MKLATSWLVTEVRLSRCNHSNARKLVNDLMTCLFDNDEMANKGMYGQVCNIHRATINAPTQALEKRKIVAMKGN